MRKMNILPWDRWNRWALVVFLLLWAASCIRVPYPEYLLLQHGPTLLAVITLMVVQNWLNVSRLSYTLILAFLSLHLVGGRYLYSYVPYDDWFEPLLSFRITDRFGFARNHYDRLVHFCFGLLIVIPTWRFARRLVGTNGWWSAVFAFAVIIAASAVYEVAEWAIAVTQPPDLAESYNGQQGDVWDPQRDMALAGLGGLVSLGVVLAVDFHRSRRQNKTK